MKFLSRVVWSEGMHLSPHHFQTQSRYFEDTFWFLLSRLRADLFGFLKLELDDAALRNGQLIVLEASGILPDGLIFDIPDSDSRPQPVELAGIFPVVESELVLHLAIPQRIDGERGCDREGTGGMSVRYGATHRELADDTISEDRFTIELAEKNLTIQPASSITGRMVSLPLARVMRDGRGGFTVDAGFLPPLLSLRASPMLLKRLQRLLEDLKEKASNVRARRRSAKAFELGTSALDVASYWFLHSLSSSLPRLSQMLQRKDCHPETIYGELAALAGGLSTFSLETSLDQVPAYGHLQLAQTFEQMEAFIRRHLELLAPSNTLRLEFTPAERYISVAPVNDERCLRRCKWIFGIRARISDAMLLRQVPALIKICSGEGVGKLVQRALPGMELIHLPVPPTAIQAQADMHYFSISLDGPCWQHILQTRRVGVYVPGEFAEAHFEVTVVMESTT